MGFVTSSVILFILSLADGHTDPFYIRFTTPKQHSLITGASRAAQGVRPEVFKELMGRDIYNYAFTNAHSPYGPAYLESIKKKLNPNSQKGLFIVTVDPWSISSETEDPNNLAEFRENELCIANTSIVNVNPNFQYLINNLSGKYYQILLGNGGSMFLHKNGWLEVSVAMDAVAIKERTDEKVRSYRENSLPKYQYSSVRLEYLKKTVRFLKKHGEVYLVRLPVHERILQIEHKLMPDFNEKLEEVISLADGFYDMTPLNAAFQYTDGNHLYKESGEIATRKIIQWIQSQRRANAQNDK